MLPHIIAIDDDPVFLSILGKVATEKNVPITLCRSVNELALLSVPRVFDVAIIDIYLDGLKSKLKGTDLLLLLRDTPVLLMSGKDMELPESTNLPFSVKGFINKQKGAASILEAALIEGRTNQLRLLA